MAKKAPTKKTKSKGGGASKKATSKPADAAKKEPIKKPPFTRKISDLDLEDNGRFQVPVDYIPPSER